MKKTTIITTICLCAAAALSVFIYFKNDNLSKGGETKANVELDSLQRKWLLTEVCAIRIPLSDTVQVADSKGRWLPLRDLTERGARIGIYISNRQCFKCWQSELDYLAAVLAERTDTFRTPVVLAGGYDNTRDFRLFAQSYDFPFPVYAIDVAESPALHSYDDATEPFYFVLQPDGTMTDILFYPNGIRHLLSDYFDHTLGQCRMGKEEKMAEANATDGDSVEVLNPVIDLGEVNANKRRAAVFHVCNKGKSACVVLDISTSCSCLVADNCPKQIKAGETADFHINFLSTTLGTFTKTVSLRTSAHQEPFVLTLKGRVVSEE